MISSKANSNSSVNSKLVQNNNLIEKNPASPSSKKFASITAESRTYNSLKLASRQHKIKQRLLSTPKHSLSSAEKSDLISQNLVKSKDLVNQMELIKNELKLIAENIRFLENLS